MARAFHTLDDGCLVEVNENNQKKYKPDRFESEPKSFLKTILWILAGLFGFLLWLIMLLLKIFFRMVTYSS